MTAERNYTLKSDLAKLCLPQEYRDSNRRLAWVNSVCVLFLFVGILGLQSPKLHAKPVSRENVVVPVFLAPPEEPLQSEPKTVPRELDVLPQESSDAPAVEPVVVADASAVAFAGPVERPVVSAPAQFPPPSLSGQRASSSSKSVQFTPRTEDWGGHPMPEYPPLALRRGYEGTVVLGIVVEPSGEVTLVRVVQSSGREILDDAALEHVRKYLRLSPGETRFYTLDITFQLKH